MRNLLYTNLTLVLFILLIAVTEKAKSQNFSWAKNIGGSTNESGYAITTDIYSNVYVTGSFSGTVDFDPGTAVYNLISAGGDDIFVAKYTQDCKLIWAIKIGGTSGDIGSGIAVDRYGNVFFVGSFMGTVDFNAGTGVNSFTSNGNQDIFIAKYSSTGTHLWAFGMGSNNWDVAEDVVVDTLGCVYFTGYFTGTIDFNPTSGVNNLTSKGSMDIFITKYNSNGNFSFANSLGSSDMDWGMSIKTDVSGNIYVTGVFSGTVDFDPGSNTYNLTSAGSTDVYIAKYSNTGNLVWAISVGGTSNDTGYSLDLDRSGNVYVTGSFQGTADFDPGNNTVNLTSSGSSDLFVAKYDNTGKYIWAKKVGGNSFDKANSIAVDLLGNSFITGEFESTVDFDPGSGYANISTAGQNDSYILKLDSNGNYQWVFQIGGTIADIGYSVTVHDSGNVFATGYFCNTVDFDPGSGTFNLTSKGGTDMYITKIFNSDCTYFRAITNPKDSAKICQGSYLELKANTGQGLTYRWFKNGIVINGAYMATLKAATSGYYAVEVTNSSSCTDTSAVVFVSSIQPPTANITAIGPITFCVGDSVILYANTGNGLLWQWRKDGKDIIGAIDSILVTKSSGDYTVLVTNTDGCSKQSSKTKITVNNLPDTSILITGNLSFCEGDSVVFTAKTTSGLSYQWTKDGNIIPGATQTSYTANKKGAYKLVATTSNSCSDSSSTINVVVNSLPEANILVTGKTVFCRGDSVILQTDSSSCQTYQWEKDGKYLINETKSIISVHQQGNYRVLITNSNLCADSSADIFVKVNDLPDTSVSVLGLTTFCEGDSVILKANSDLTYQWIMDGNKITGETNSSYTAKSSGNYSVNLINNEGCSNSSNPISITVNPLPEVNIGKDTSICKNHTLLLDAGFGCASYLWSTGATSQTLLLDNNIDTGYYSYWVKTTNSFGCAAIDTIVVYIISCSDINETNKNFEIKLFPNPSNGNFILSIKGIQSGIGSISILDVNGKSIFHSDKIELQAYIYNQEFSFADLTKGIYFIKVVLGDITTFKKVIIQ